MLRKWDSFRSELPYIEKISIPRWIIQLHGFADAAMTAYGASFYIRSEDENHQIHAHLVFAESRVALLKTATIPKLELCAAHLLAELLDDVRAAHSIAMDQCYLWSDSMVALQWIAKSPAKLQTFQAHRVAKIQEKTEGATWQHVPTKDNPADLVSRGVPASKLVNNQLWWNGPSWLVKPINMWPVSK